MICEACGTREAFGTCLELGAVCVPCHAAGACDHTIDASADDDEPACRDCGRPCTFELDSEGFHA